MVMAFSVLGLVRGGVTVLNPACVGKSYPRFLRDLRDVQKNSKPIVIVGMRGVGKTNFGRRLASKLRLRFADADKLFEKQYGNIRTFVEQKGWPTFRLREEEVIASALRRGYVLSLGGGAVLSEKTRSVLSSGAIVIWLDADDRELIRRLKSGKRPPLTDLPIEQEVPKISAERRPFYESVARIHIPKHLRFSLQVPFAVRALRSIVNPLLPKR
jgi:shikimate kinase